MVWWVLLAVLVFSFYVSPLLAPKVKGPAASLGDVQPPTATKGTPIPVPFGTVKLGPNVTWYGNVRAEEIRTITGNRTALNPFAVNHSTVTGHRYGADIAGVICHGPIDELMDFQFDDVSMRKYAIGNTNYVIGSDGVVTLHIPLTPAFPQLPPATDEPTHYTFNAPDLFGGDSGEGGIVGKCDFFWGKLTQNASTVLSSLVGESVSRYKGIVHFVMYDATYGNSPYIRPFYAVVRRCPVTVSPDADTANIDGSANPADAIFEIMTNTRWGLGKPASVFDTDSFRDAAITLKAEGMGIDIALTAQDTAENMIGEILRHIDGVVFSNPLTGLITLSLARADYDVATLLHVDQSNCTKFTEFKRSTWPETINEVKVNYIARGELPGYTFKTDTVQAQNLASMQAMGDVASTTMDFNMFSSSEQAIQAAFRTLRVVSTPLASGTLTTNRKMASLTVGSVFVLDWAPLGISGMVMRVASMKLGPLDDNTIDLQVVEDVFNTAPVVFVAPPSTSWTPPATLPAAHARALSVPAPYYLTQGDQFIGLNFVVRGNGASTSWDGMYVNDPTVPDAPPQGTILTKNSPFTPAGTLVNIYPYNTDYQDEVGFLVQDFNSDMSKLLGTDAAGLAAGDLLAFISSNDGGEVIAWREIVPQATPGRYIIRGVLRGQFDTLPLDHPVGATVYFFWPSNFQSYFPGMDQSEVAPTASSQTDPGDGYKFWPQIKGITSSLPPAPPAGKIQHPGVNTPSLDPMRAVLPAPVGDTQLNAVKNNDIDPSALLPDTNDLTWVSRNRLTQTVPVVHDGAGVAAEAGETYEVDVVHVSKTTGEDLFGLIHQYTGVASPLEYTNLQFEKDITAVEGTAVADDDPRRTGGGIRFLIRSVNGTKKSYDVALPGFRRKQEVGYPIIPSLQFANIASPSFSATGGTVMDIAGYRVHIFTANADFVAIGNTSELDILLVGGGGGGGHGQDRTGGGGGAGGVRRLTNQTLGSGTFPVVVGAGGAGGITPSTTSHSGGNSSFNGLVALGGGKGADFNGKAGGAGGSGGGAYHDSGSSKGLGTAGQGNDGGGVGFNSGSGTGVFTGSGGGGAGAAGVAGTSGVAGAGGIGVQHDITGSLVYYGGGGGGSSGNYGGQNIQGGAGGQGGGGAGATGTGSTPVVGTNGTANTGGGGGAGAKASGGNGGNGGSGIVIIRYPVTP
jgi:hypothetical protein